MMLKSVAKSEYNNLSDLIRAGIEKELNLQMYKDNLDFIIKEIDKIIDVKLDPVFKSLRKMNAKYLITSAINTYLLGEVLNRLLGDDMHKIFISLLEKSRTKANYYINHDTENMPKEDLFDYYSIGDEYRKE